MKDFIEFLAKKVVSNPGSVEVTLKEDGKCEVYTIMVDEDQIGMLVGRGGATATAIRTLCRAFAKADSKHIVIKIEHR